MNARFAINPDEEFPHLPQAPIVEAVIHWQAHPAEPFEPATLLGQLKELLPDYPHLQPQHEFSVEHHGVPQGTRFNQSHSWQAFQLSSSDGGYVAQFNRTGLLFGRLPPGFPGELDLPPANYVHQSRFDVPGHHLQLNLIQTVQQAPPESDRKLNLLVDLDIFSTGEKVDQDEFQSRKLFRQMRWLKNKAFFTIFSNQALEDFRR